MSFADVMLSAYQCHLLSGISQTYRRWRLRPVLAIMILWSDLLRSTSPVLTILHLTLDDL
nr:hypothetical protein GZ31B6_3 [uncultured archaeon GZfos31B6]